MQIKDSIIKRILEERERQDKKWGIQQHPPAWWMLIIMEEIGEMAKAIQEDGNLEEEAIQSIASIMAMLESMNAK